VISTQTTDSICLNDKEVWHTIRKELEDIGITAAAFDANKDFIFKTVLNAIGSGAFEEQPSDESLIAVRYEDSSVSSDEASKGNLISS
jgi:hypothetical protein